MKIILIILFAVVLVIVSFVVIFFIMKNMQQISNNTSDTNNLPDNNSIAYAAIGDSYTIGQGVLEDERWPNLLVKDLNLNGININLQSNPARSGWTTQNVIDSELKVFNEQKIDFATLLIGVNDWVQGIDKETFHKNITFILDFMESKVHKNIVIVTIPDFGVTPSGK